MDYSIRYLKRRDLLPMKVATVEWHNHKKDRQSCPVTVRHSPKNNTHRTANMPFFARKMNQFIKKNEVSQCLKIINMLKKLECEEDIRRMSFNGQGSGKTKPTKREGFPMRENWRLKSARSSRIQGCDTLQSSRQQEATRPGTTASSGRLRSSTFH